MVSMQWIDFCTINLFFIVLEHERFFLLSFVEHPFLNVTPGTHTVVTVEEGKRWDFKPQVNALPAPDKIVW